MFILQQTSESHSKKKRGDHDGNRQEAGSQEDNGQEGCKEAGSQEDRCKEEIALDLTPPRVPILSESKWMISDKTKTSPRKKILLAACAISLLVGCAAEPQKVLPPAAEEERPQAEIHVTATAETSAPLSNQSETTSPAL